MPVRLGGDILKLQKKWSKAFAIILAFMLCISGIVFPEFSTAESTPNPKDKSKLINGTLSTTVTQNGKELTDTIDPKSDFKVSMTFTFPIVDNNLIKAGAADGITDVSQQIDEGDYAIFTLGKNLIPNPPEQNKIGVYINAEGDADNGNQIGTITLTKQEDGTLQARMDFVDPNGKFDYEKDGRKDLTVEFSGMFKLDDQASSTPGSENNTVEVLDKKFTVPGVEEKINYEFKKSGKLNDPKTKDSITWTCTVKKSSNLGNPTKLGGETFKDSLEKVGKYIPGSFMINEKEVKDKDVYDPVTKTIKYKFKNDYDKDNAKITFKTEVPKEDKNGKKIMKVDNKANLEIPEKKDKEAKTSVPIHNSLGITKNLKSINYDKDKREREMVWTIVAGAPYENFGPAWIGDVLSGTLKGQETPKRVELSYEHSESGKDDNSWTPVDSAEIMKAGTFDPKDFPELTLPEENTNCPSFAKYDHQIYELGKNWHDPVKLKESGDYKHLENHWFFIKELDGLYRITVKLYYDEDVEIGPLKNEAEIHTCTEGSIITKEPPVYSAIGTITKYNEYGEEYNKELSQGKIPWNVQVDFSKVFPSSNRFVYEAFYWGNEDDFKAEKKDLKVDSSADIPDEVFESLIGNEDKPTRFNFNQAYVKGSLKSKPVNKENEGKQPGEPANVEEPLKDTIIPLKNKAGVRVGEIVKIHGFDERKVYSFTLKTMAQDIIEHLEQNVEKKTAGDKTYKNTAVLAVGMGPTFKILNDSASRSLPVNLLSKYLIKRDTDLTIVEKPGDEADPGNNGNPEDPGNNTEPKREYLDNIIPAGAGEAFNYKDRTVLFRIDVNRHGMNLSDYIKELSGENKPKGDFTKLEVTDVLDKDLKLEKVVSGGSDDFYIYEADPSEPYNSAKAFKKITPEEAKVSFDKNNLKWTFEKYDGKPYVIVIRAKVPKEKFEEIIKTTKQGDPIKFKNKVNLKISDKDLAEAEATAEANPHMLTKSVPGIDGDRLKWTFEYRPFNINLKNMVFDDKLDENIGLPTDKKGNILLDNFKIFRSNDLQSDGSYDNPTEVKVVSSDSPKDGEVSVKYDAEKHHIYFTVPDTPSETNPYSYIFKYETIMRPTNLDAKIIANDVELTANEETLGAKGHSEISTERYAAFATIQNYPYFAIKKVDAAGNPLEGATFKYENKDKDEVKYTSGTNGMIYITKLKEGINEIKEIKSPDGYIKLTKPIRISVEGKKITILSSNGMKGRGTVKSPLIFKNNKIQYVNLPVTKKWVNDNPNDRPDNITVTLIKNGKPTDEFLTLDSSNGWKGIFKDLPQTDVDGNKITYTVKETKVPGYETKISGNQISGYVITNSIPGSDGPRTGDSNHLYAWGVIALISALGFIFLRRKIN